MELNREINSFFNDEVKRHNRELLILEEKFAEISNSYNLKLLALCSHNDFYQENDYVDFLFEEEQKLLKESQDSIANLLVLMCKENELHFNILNFTVDPLKRVDYSKSVHTELDFYTYYNLIDLKVASMYCKVPLEYLLDCKNLEDYDELEKFDWHMLCCYQGYPPKFWEEFESYIDFHDEDLYLYQTIPIEFIKNNIEKIHVLYAIEYYGELFQDYKILKNIFKLFVHNSIFFKKNYGVSVDKVFNLISDRVFGGDKEKTKLLYVNFFLDTNESKEQEIQRLNKALKEETVKKICKHLYKEQISTERLEEYINIVKSGESINDIYINKFINAVATTQRIREAANSYQARKDFIIQRYFM